MRNMWYPWTCHWRDKWDYKFFVRLRWKLVITFDYVSIFYNNIINVWFK